MQAKVGQVVQHLLRLRTDGVRLCSGNLLRESQMAEEALGPFVVFGRRQLVDRLVGELAGHSPGPPKNGLPRLRIRHVIW